jgi:hypothetical protein
MKKIDLIVNDGVVRTNPKAISRKVFHDVIEHLNVKYNQKNGRYGLSTAHFNETLKCDGCPRELPEDALWNYKLFKYCPPCHFKAFFSIRSES